MIVPVLTYRSIVKLCVTRTQSNQILLIVNRAKKIIGTDKLPKIVRRCLDSIACENLNGYFEL